MSNALQTRALITAMEAAILAAWNVPVSVGNPRVAGSFVAPYASVHWDSVDVEFGGAVSTVLSTTQNKRDYGDWTVALIRRTQAGSWTLRKSIERMS